MLLIDNSDSFVASNARKTNKWLELDKGVFVGSSADIEELLPRDSLTRLYLQEKSPQFERIVDAEYKGYRFYILWYRNHPNAYVSIPKTHPWYLKGYNELPNPGGVVHGGWTFSDKNVGAPYNLADGWYIGWDYAHIGDYIKGNDTNYDRTWTTADIVEECHKVIDLLAKVAKGDNNL